jgi:hypothetical protein
MEDQQDAHADVHDARHHDSGDDARHVLIDGHDVTVRRHDFTGTSLLATIDKKPCAYELIAVFRHRENRVIEPDEHVDLQQHGLEGFITAHREIVEITIKDKHPRIERGDYSVSRILDLVDETVEGFILLEEKEGDLDRVPDDGVLHIRGCEVFDSQVRTGSSS